jgi:hypothetical protein
MQLFPCNQVHGSGEARPVYTAVYGNDARVKQSVYTWALDPKGIQRGTGIKQRQAMKVSTVPFWTKMGVPQKCYFVQTSDLARKRPVRNLGHLLPDSGTSERLERHVSENRYVAEKKPAQRRRISRLLGADSHSSQAPQMQRLGKCDNAERGRF